MKIEPVCRYISQQLKTTVSRYSFQGELWDSFSSQPDFRDPFLAEEKIRSFLAAPSEDTMPMLYLVGNSVCYARFSFEDGYYLIGPVRIQGDNVSRHRLQHILDITLSGAQISAPLSTCHIPRLLRTVLLLYNALRETDLDMFTCLSSNLLPLSERAHIHQETTAAMFENREHEVVHNPYRQELRMMSAIENGNIEQLKSSWEESHPGVLGATSKDPLKSARNAAIYTICASARAAIRGGLQQEESFSLTDAYARQIDEIEDTTLWESLVHNAQMELTQMVRDHKNERKEARISAESIPVVENAKQYIFSHLHSRLMVQEIADALNIHPGYLSTLFKKQEGISIYKYVMKQKIDVTKNLLTYSEYSFLEISNYLGFASQSHLGKQFKTITGMTLKEYQDKYHDRNFTL